jgi:hypothetical protein
MSNFYFNFNLNSKKNILYYLMNNNKKSKKNNKDKTKEKENNEGNVDKKELLSAVESFLKINEDKIKTSEKDKEILIQETSKIKKSINEKIEKLDSLKQKGDIEELYKFSKNIVFTHYLY